MRVIAKGGGVGYRMSGPCRELHNPIGGASPTGSFEVSHDRGPGRLATIQDIGGEQSCLTFPFYTYLPPPHKTMLPFQE